MPAQTAANHSNLRRQREPSTQALLQEAQSGGFEIVLAEALDRISRDQADFATLFKLLRFVGVPIFTKGDQ